MGWLDWNTDEEKLLRAARKTKVNPNSLRFPRNKIDQAAVEMYVRNPDKTTFLDGDGLPFVIKRRNGRLDLINGKHRALAAIQARRRLTVMLAEES
jgi:hypothetical protein